MEKMLVGLTGKYCSGKNFIADILRRRGLAVLDIDKLGHIAIENRKTAIIARFGEAIQNPPPPDGDGSINRRLLGEKVFGRKNELTALEAIVHPEVNRLTEEWIDAHIGENLVLNAAVLHKSSVFPRLNGIILVSAPRCIRFIRAKRRDKLPFTELTRRFSSQNEFNAQYSAGNADIYRVENPGIGFRRGRMKPEKRIEAILSELGLKTEPCEGGFY